VLVVALLSLVGIPPLAGFVGKVTLFTAAIEGGYGWLAILAVVNTVVSLFYYLRVVGPMYFEDDTVAYEPAPLLGAWATTATISAGLATIVVGLAAGPLLDVLASALMLP
jgi:NADH-quinone oxidoreductase subunit N